MNETDFSNEFEPELEEAREEPEGIHTCPFCGATAYFEEPGKHNMCVFCDQRGCERCVVRCFYCSRYVCRTCLESLYRDKGLPATKYDARGIEWVPVTCPECMKDVDYRNEKMMYEYHRTMETHRGALMMMGGVAMPFISLLILYLLRRFFGFEFSKESHELMFMGGMQLAYFLFFISCLLRPLFGIVAGSVAVIGGVAWLGHYLEKNYGGRKACEVIGLIFVVGVFAALVACWIYAMRRG